MKRFCLFAACLLLLCACGRRRGVPQAEAPVDAPSVPEFYVFDLESSIGTRTDTVLLNTLLDSVWFIPLETKKESLIPAWSYTLGIIGGRLLISGGGSTNGNGIQQFDLSGNYTGTFVRKGRGPGELPHIHDWYTHDALQRLNAVGSPNKMVIHSFQNNRTSDFQTKEFLEFEQVPINDGTFVSTSQLFQKSYQDKPYLAFRDVSGEVVAALHDPEKRDIYFDMAEGRVAWPIEGRQLFPHHSGDALFQDAYNDTTYMVRGPKDIRPRFVFKRGRYMPVPRNENDPASKKNRIFIREIIDTDPYVFLYYIYKEKLFFDIWSKATGRLVSRMESENYWNFQTSRSVAPYEFPGGNRNVVYIEYATNDTIYGIVSPRTASTFIDGVTPEDNPVIMIGKLSSDRSLPTAPGNAR